MLVCRMRSAAIAIVCLAVAVCAVAGDVANTDAVAPTLWSQPQTKSVEAHPIATTYRAPVLQLGFGPVHFPVRVRHRRRGVER